MMGFHHREPGIFGSAFLDSRVSFELIPDGVHLHRVAYEIAIKLKEPSKTVLVSDSLPTAGFPDGEYNYGDLKILLKNGVARLESGALAGSNITLNEGIKYISELGLLKPRELIQMTTYSPATVIDVHHQKGSLMPGMDADIVVLDRNFDSKLTIIEGDIVYEGGV
jgi:N-acetylglucosamine-6-phosphate deacetylase